MTELKDTFSLEKLLPHVLLVEVDTVESVGEGKKVVSEVTTRSLIVNLLLISTQIVLTHWKIEITNLHTKNLFVEGKGHLRVLNPHHGVVEFVGSGVRGGSGHFCELAESGWTR